MICISLFNSNKKTIHPNTCPPEKEVGKINVENITKSQYSKSRDEFPN